MNLHLRRSSTGERVYNNFVLCREIIFFGEKRTSEMIDIYRIFNITIQSILLHIVNAGF